MFNETEFEDFCQILKDFTPESIYEIRYCLEKHNIKCNENKNGTYVIWKSCSKKLLSDWYDIYLREKEKINEL